MPGWLAAFRRGDRLHAGQLFESRVVYYPGSGTDGHPVAMFGAAHSAHCFVYVDYAVDEGMIEAHLEESSPNRFKGYHVFASLSLKESDIVCGGWIPHLEAGEVSRAPPRFATTKPYGSLVLLERDVSHDDNHGPERLAILFLGADGIATFDALFCQVWSKGVFAILLQDHGFGGNYDKFGRGGLMETIADRSNVWPTWLLVGDGTEPWKDFRRVPELDGDRGGVHRTPRYLHERQSTSN